MPLKPKLYKGTWCNKEYHQGLSDWALLCGRPRSFFERGLQKDEDFQSIIDRSIIRPLNKIKLYKARWHNKDYEMSLADWSIMCDCSRGYFENRLKAGDDFADIVKRREKIAAHNQWYLQKPIGRNGSSMVTLC